MAKNVKTLSLKKLRDELVKNCDSLISWFQEAESRLDFAETTGTRLATRLESNLSSGLSAELREYLSKPLDISALLVPVHGSIIQEWWIYIDSIFGKVVLHYLESGLESKLPSQRLDLKTIKTTSLVDMRESIADAARELFSRRSYDERIEILRKIFNIKIPTKRLNSQMKNHVEIRNIFVHNRGEVREVDLKKIRQPPNGYFEVLKNDGSKRKFKKGKVIELSVRAVQDLNQLIKTYSDRFKELS